MPPNRFSFFSSTLQRVSTKIAFSQFLTRGKYHVFATYRTRRYGARRILLCAILSWEHELCGLYTFQRTTRQLSSIVLTMQWLQEIACYEVEITFVMLNGEWMRRLRLGFLLAPLCESHEKSIYHCGGKLSRKQGSMTSIIIKMFVLSFDRVWRHLPNDLRTLLI